MRRICWLHISDIHMRVRDAWSQDFVPKAMCEDIARLRTKGMAVRNHLASAHEWQIERIVKN